MMNKKNNGYIWQHPEKIKNIKKSVSIKINDTTLEVVCKYKYLEVILYETLNYNSHIKMVKQKVKQRSYLLKKVRNIVSQKETLVLYKSSILPFLDQGDLFFMLVAIKNCYVVCKHCGITA